MAGGDDELRIEASLSGDLADQLRRIEQRLEDVDRALARTGQAGESAGDKVSDGADKAASSLGRTGRAAESASDSLDDVASSAEQANRPLRTTAEEARKIRDRMREQSEANRAAARSLDDVADDATEAAAGLRAAGKGGEAAARGLSDTAREARQAERALDGAGNEATSSGAQAAAAATWWERLAARMDRGDRISRRWAATQDSMRWATWTDRLTRFTARAREFTAIDWDKSSKKLGTLSRAFGGFSKVMMAVKFSAIIGAVFALLGALSALGAGAVGIVGGLGNVAVGLAALGPVALSAIFALKGITAAMKEAEPQVKALKDQFAGFSRNIAAGGLREGLAILGRDTVVLSGRMNTLGTFIGESAKTTLIAAGVYLKSAGFLQRFGVIADGVKQQTQDLGLTGVKTLSALTTIMAGASPVANRLTGDLLSLTTSFASQMNASYESGRMTEYLDNAYTNLTRAIGVVTDWMVGLYRIFRIGAEESRWMGDSIEASALRFREWTASAEGQNSIRQYFIDAMPAVRETGLLLRDLLVGFGALATSQDVAPLIRQIRTELLPAFMLLAQQFTGSLLPGLVELATKLALLFAGMDFTGLMLLIELLNMFVGALVWASDNIPGFSLVLSTLLTTLFLLGPAFKVASWGATAFDRLGKVLGWIGKLPGIRILVFNLRMAWSLIGGFPGLMMTVGRGILTVLSLIGRGLAAAFLGSNPIGWIILAVSALVGIFWWLWENCAWFRDAVWAVLGAVGGFFVWLGGVVMSALGGIGGFFAWVWGGVVAAWNWLGATISAIWTGYIWPVLSAIGTGFKWLIAIIFTIFVAPFVLLWYILSSAITWFWTNVVLPVLGAIGAFFGWIFNNVILPVVNFFVGAWNFAMAVLGFAYHAFVVPMLTALGSFFSFIFGVVVMGVVNFFVGAWNWAVGALAWAYYAIVQPFLGAMGAFFSFIISFVIMPVVNFLVWVWNMAMLSLQLAYYTYIVPMMNAFGAVLNWLWLNVATPVINGILWLWNSLQAGIAWVWYNLLQPVFNAVGTGLDVLRGWFQSAIDGILWMWNGLRAGLAAPVNFIIGTVWNRGILPAWNWVAEKLGLPLGQPLAEIPAFATGGGIRGPGTGTSDDVLARVSNGEHIWTDKEVKAAGGHEGVKRLRRMVLMDSLPFYASGGPVTPQEMTAVAAGAVPGTRMSSGYRPGDSGWHGKNRAADLVGNMGAINNFIGTKFPGSSELIYTPGINIKNGRPHSYNAAVKADHYDHVHWANNGAGEGEGGGGWLAQTLWQIGKPILDGILNPIIDSIPFNGPPQFLDIPKALARKGRDEFYRWAEEKLGAITVGGGGEAIPGSGPVFDQVSAVANGWGWGPGSNQWGALARLIQKESSWNPNAQNPTSTAYGLFQFLNSTWGTVGGSKTSNPGQQTEYGLRYVKNKYRDPVGALAFHNANNWYDDGGYLPPGLSMVMNGTGAPEPVFTGGQWDTLSGLLDTSRLVDAMLSTPQSWAAVAASQAEQGGDGSGGMGDVLDELQALRQVVAERPPAMSVSSDEVRREVDAAWNDHARRERTRGRYQY